MLVTRSAKICLQNTLRKKKRSKHIYSNEEGHNTYVLEGQSHSDIKFPKAICNVICMGFSIAINLGEWIHCCRRKAHHVYKSRIARKAKMILRKSSKCREHTT